MVGTWLGELYYCSCLTVLLDPAWVLLSHVLQTFISALYREDALPLPGRAKQKILATTYKPYHRLCTCNHPIILCGGSENGCASLHCQLIGKLMMTTVTK